MHCLCCLSLLSLCCLSLLSLDLGLYHGFLLSLRPVLVFRPILLRRGGLSAWVQWSFCSAVENVCSALVGSSPVCSALVGSSPVCSALVGSSPVCSPWWAPVPSPPPGFLLCRLCLGPQPLHFQWTWPSVPSPVPPPLHRPPGLYRSVWNPLLGGGGYVTNPVHALPFTRHQRSPAHHIDSCTTQLLHITLDCISHHPCIDDTHS